MECQSDLFDTFTSEREFRAVLADRVLALLPRALPTRDRGALLGDIARVKRAAPCFLLPDLRKNMSGLGSLWGYFPHFVEVKVRGRSLADKLADREELRKIADKTVAFCLKHEGGRISTNRVLQSLKAYNGHHVSNFRPTAAKDLYLHLVGKRASIFDPCAGWGGRLVGAVGADYAHYMGYDASRETVRGCERLILDAGETRATVVHGAIEDSLVGARQYDIAFTSPPYFNAEAYSEDAEQSCVRYRTYEGWRDGFLCPLARKMAHAVGWGGFVALNIADVQGKPLVEDAKDALRGAGLEYHATYRYILSSIAGKGEKFEPVLVFKKRKPPLDTTHAGGVT